MAGFSLQGSLPRHPGGDGRVVPPADGVAAGRRSLQTLPGGSGIFDTFMSSKSPAGKPRHTLKFWMALAAVALLAAFLVVSPAFPERMGWAFDWAEAFMGEHPALGAAVFFVFSAVSAMLAFASSAVLVPPASQAWGKPLTFLLLWGGWLLGAVAAFGIGRLARPLLERTCYREKLEKYEEYVSKRMKFWAVLLFCFAVPSEIPGYLFGGMRYPFLKFLAAIAVAEAGYALGVVLAGESLVVDEPLPFFIALGGLALIAIVAGLLLRAAKKRRSGGLSPR